MKYELNCGKMSVEGIFFPAIFDLLVLDSTHDNVGSVRDAVAYMR